MAAFHTVVVGTDCSMRMGSGMLDHIELVAFGLEATIYC
jgi:hypothetical protein